MGVAGDFLPRVLESTGRVMDLKEYKEITKKHRKRPLRIGIDVSAWIYRAGFAFGEKLMHDERHLTSYGRANLQRESGADEDNHHAEEASAMKIRDYCEACANYVVRRLEILKQETQADLLVVFDGRTPPIKLATVSQRRKSREAYQSIRDTGNGDTMTADNNNNTVDIEERFKANRRAGPGKHVATIVNVILEKLRKRAQVDEHRNGENHDSTSPAKNALAAWMVAPYEADSQLAYLSKQSYIDLVITEDTDLIAHGCRSVLYKCIENHGDKDNVHIEITRGKLVEFQDLGGSRWFCRENNKPDLADFTPIMMAVLFVLLGCDYNGHRKLKGIGIIKASKIVRKAFLESSTKVATAETEIDLSRQNQQHRIVLMSPASVASNPSPRKQSKKNQLSVLDIVWKEAYEQSYESKSVFTDEFKRDYQKSFVEALWMYRHPIVFEPMIRTCIQCPSPVTNELGDCELLENLEYSQLATNPIRIMQVVGELPPTQEECIAIAEGRSHGQWRLRKPTPIYCNDNANEQMEVRSPADALGKKRKSPSSKKSDARDRGHKNSCSPAFRSKRTKDGKENQIEHGKVLDEDEIAAVARGGVKKVDRRPEHGISVMSRNLFADASPNLLASTTPSQSSSKATTMTLSQTPKSQTPKTSQSSSKQTSVNLLASTSSQSQMLESPIVQTQEEFNWGTPSPAKAWSQEDNAFPTQHVDSRPLPEQDFFTQEPTQRPLPEQDFFTQETTPSAKRRTLPRAAKRTPSSAFQTP